MQYINIPKLFMSIRTYKFSLNFSTPYQNSSHNNFKLAVADLWLLFLNMIMAK